MDCSIENEAEYLSREKELLFEIKKGKLKTEKLLKIAILDEQEPSRQSADRTKAVQVWSWVCIYENLESDRHSIYIWK